MAHFFFFLFVQSMWRSLMCVLESVVTYTARLRNGFLFRGKQNSSKTYYQWVLMNLVCRGLSVHFEITGNNRVLPIRFHSAVCIYAHVWNGCSQSFSFSDRWSRGTKTLGTRLISSPYCAVSAPWCLKNIKNLTRWNAIRCYSFRTTYLIFEIIHFFYNSFIDFVAARLFHQVIRERTKHKASCPQWRLTWNFEFTSCKLSRNVHILWRHAWNKTAKRKQALKSAQYGLATSAVDVGW